MPRTGYIYEIRSNNKSITEYYIGSCWDMGKRLQKHIRDCYSKNGDRFNIPVYKYIRENGNFHTFTMRVIDSGECEDVTELVCGEQFYIDMAGGIENLLNDRNAMVLPKEQKKMNTERRDRIQKENKETKRFPCELCGIYCVTKCHLVVHLKTNKHKKKLAAENQSKNP